MTKAEDLSDDDFFAALSGLGAAVNVARDPDVDPEIRNMAADAVERGTDQLRGRDSN